MHRRRATARRIVSMAGAISVAACGCGGGGSSSAQMALRATALAPAGFGSVAGDLLIGNFGDETINSFDPSNGKRPGSVSLASGTQLVRRS